MKDGSFLQGLERNLGQNPGCSPGYDPERNLGYDLEDISSLVCFNFASDLKT